MAGRMVLYHSRMGLFGVDAYRRTAPAKRRVGMLERGQSHTPSQSPFRYVQFAELAEKTKTKPDDIALERTPSSSRFPPAPRRTQSQRSPPPNTSSSPHNTPYSRPRGLRILNLIRPWLPLIVYALSSLILVHFGYAVLFVLIFITTFVRCAPPVPMYSTLIILSGYTFGPWVGATLSYFAALSGALTVFLISRTLLHDSISRWLESASTIKRVVRAVEKRPKLLFLVRLAPYPYNVMNCLLAASPTLTLRSYTLCTAASLFKVIIHTSLGASIHSFKNYNTAVPEGDEPEETGGADAVARTWTIAGVVLCVAIFVYISYVARRAVDSELDDDEVSADAEETEGFLANTDAETGHANSARPMVELRR
ncbi:hypothetical protein B0H12DRAFT_1084244 [Mycena haematopus]|nr:hypothetical protein B0H12DRAFT_1084244 [Mycena haematopus]